MNKLSNDDFYKTVFSEHDDSISLSLERDPLGLQPIWTSLGNKVFSGVTTSVATDIRNYTINLLHHAVVFSIKFDYPEVWSELRTESRKVGDNTITDSEVQNRLILALEMMLAYAAVKNDWSYSSGILGISSARKRWSSENHRDFTRINLKEVPRDPRKEDYDGFVTLLVRQSGLGINGRYKGPFKNMGLLDKNGDYPYNSGVWREVIALFNADPDYKKLLSRLTDFFVKDVREKSFELSLVETFEFIESYTEVFNQQYPITGQIELFWLEKLKISPGSLAKKIYDEIDSESDFESLAKVLFTNNCAIPEAKRICEVEPFLVLNEYLFAALIQKPKDITLHQNLENKIRFYAHSIKIEEEYTTRLRDLINVANSENISIGLINYHNKIATEREIHPWISDKEHVFKKTKYISDLDEMLKTMNENSTNIAWRRGYYLSSIKQIKLGFKGLSA